MSLYSLAFVAFFSTLLVAYFGIGRVFDRGQWLVLLVASLGFYCLMGSWETLFYVLVTAVVTWLAPLCFERMSEIEKAQRSAAERAARKALKQLWAKRRRVVLFVALAIPFGILAHLKYWNVILYQMGAAATPMSLGLLLPLGISFYTFQSAGYLIDAYNKLMTPERNFAKHLLFVTYFPQMIQGPINRYGALAPQLFARHKLKEIQSSRALLLVGYGMLKKLVMADLLVDPIAKILNNYSLATPGSLVALAILMYSAQQYGDFSGGIDMVEGFSELLGIEMAQNFRRPYFAVSLADFWRRWHISLGQWMRDYVFYPIALTRPMRALGSWAGSRLGRQLGRTLPACIANIIVFLLVGVWHGAEAHFVVWGLYNGVVIALSDLLHPLFDHLGERLGVRNETRTFRVVAIFRTFLVVNVGWYFDRIEELTTSLSCLSQTFFDFSLTRLPGAVRELGATPGDYAQVSLALVSVCMVFVMSAWAEGGSDVRARIVSWPLPLRLMLYSFVFALIAVSFVFRVGGGFLYANY